METLNIWRAGLRAAWSSLWLVDEMEGHKLVAIPRLRLSQEITLELTDHIPYAQVFGKATMQVLDDPAREFHVVHATFALYRTGEPDISAFAVIVPDPALTKPNPSAVIARTAAMLRGDI